MTWLSGDRSSPIFCCLTQCVFVNMDALVQMTIFKGRRPFLRHQSLVTPAHSKAALAWCSVCVGILVNRLNVRSSEPFSAKWMCNAHINYGHIVRWSGWTQQDWCTRCIGTSVYMGSSLVHRYAVNRAHRYRESVFWQVKNRYVTVSNKNYMTSLNHVFNISSNCLSGNNHALSQYSPNPVNFLSIRGDYFYTLQNIRQSRHVSHSHFFCARETREMSPLSQLLWRSALALIGLRMREAFRQWKFPALDVYRLSRTTLLCMYAITAK